MAEDRQLVLLVEDDLAIRRFVRTTLESHGLEVQDAATGKQALSLAAELKPQVVILDLGLPDMDGLEVARKLREWSDVPILVLSARSLEGAKVAALDAGADDYLTKPFGTAELLARIRAALRRAGGGTRRDQEFTQGDIRVDLVKRQVLKGGKVIHLTPIEYKLLTVLIRNRGKVMTHRQLLNEVWGGAHSEDNHYVRIYMAQLRTKLETDPAQPRLLLTETGVGYRLMEPDRP